MSALEQAAEYRVHPVCDLFPMMDTEALVRLCDDVLENGLIHPIVLHDGQVVDGRNRLRACQETGADLRFSQWKDVYRGTMALTQWIWSENVERRHLTKDQIAAAITARRSFEEGRAAEQRRLGALKAFNDARSDGSSDDVLTDWSEREVKEIPGLETGTTRGNLAKEAGVSERRIQRAMNIQKVDPELLKDVARGTITALAAEAKIKEAEIQAAEPSKRQQMIENAVKQRMVQVLSAVSGACRGLPELNVSAIRNQCLEKEIKVWGESAQESITRLREFASALIKG